MANPFLGQIIMFGGNFAPRGYAFCDGQLIAIAQNSALFSIIGTIYGGDGRTTFALPDLRGRAPIHQGNGPGLTSRRIGTRTGTETNTLSLRNLPSHSHTVSADLSIAPRGGGPATSTSPINNFPADSTDFAGTPNLYSDTADTTVRAGALNLSLNINIAGNSSPVNNMAPFQAVNFIIALTGIFPSRS